MPASTRAQPSTQSDRRLRKRPKTTTATPVAKATSDINVVDLTDDQDDMPLRLSQSEGEERRQRWRTDVDKLKTAWQTGEIEGYGGLIASIQSESHSTWSELMLDFSQGDTDLSIHFTLHYEDMDGREYSYGLTMVFEGAP